MINDTHVCSAPPGKHQVQFDHRTGDLFVYGIFSDPKLKVEKKFMIKYEFSPADGKWEILPGFYYLDELEIGESYQILSMILHGWRKNMTPNQVTRFLKDQSIRDTVVSFLVARELCKPPES